jgi:ribosomal protein S18 acetylase RimI-like enzyme
VELTFALVEASESGIFEHVAPGTFDRALDTRLLADFLNDTRHHIAVAMDGEMLVGFVSAVDYVHPDKPRQMWVNEVGVAESYRGAGVGRGLMELMVQRARDLGASELWVLTDEDNAAAQALYRSAGLAKMGTQLLYSRKLTQTV